MTYRVEILPSARRQIKKLPSDVQIKVRQAIVELTSEPRPISALKLTGRNAYRIRLGNYRVIYEIYDEVLIVTVVAVGHRRDVYR